jgi:hypothetical protein
VINLGKFLKHPNLNLPIVKGVIYPLSVIFIVWIASLIFPASKKYINSIWEVLIFNISVPIWLSIIIIFALLISFKKIKQIVKIPEMPKLITILRNSDETDKKFAYDLLKVKYLATDPSVQAKDSKIQDLQERVDLLERLLTQSHENAMKFYTKYNEVMENQLVGAKNKIEELETEKRVRAEKAYADLSKNINEIKSSIEQHKQPDILTVLSSISNSGVLAESTGVEPPNVNTNLKNIWDSPFFTKYKIVDGKIVLNIDNESE